MRIPLTFLFLLLPAAGTSPLLAGDEPAHAEMWTEKIEPILRDHCFKCHSHAENKSKGGLLADSFAALLEGGDSGPALVPGKPEESLIVEAIGYGNEDLQMPPKDKRLAPEQIAAITEWVRLGAPAPKPAGRMAVRPRGGITDDDRAWWAFQAVSNPAPPAAGDGAWAANDLDRFILAKLEENGLAPAPAAEPAQLLRRVYFDLIGLPPSPKDVDTFTADSSPAAYDAVVESLLASPRYGERWARHWLDLARYAESDGFKADDYRPDSWRYRDYVIGAFNADKPYDRFVQEQLAGDELFPGDLDALVATGFLRHGIYEYNNRDVAGQWVNMLNEVTDVTADVFMGLGMQCARCHDHKFDPILQKDYFRLQAFFAPLSMPEDELKVASAADRERYEKQLAAWEERTSGLRAKIDAIVEPANQKAADDAITKFPPETQSLIRKPADERTPWERQIVEIAWKQVTYEWKNVVNKMRGEDKDRVVALQKELSAFDGEKPALLPVAFSVRDIGPLAPPVTIPKKAALGEIEPGFPTILQEEPARVETGHPHSTGRRATLAHWLTDPANPLTARVMVNRVWQHHFGQGLVATASDFGKLGQPPSHPELLDWLTRRFVAGGWRLKDLHRLVVKSAAYRQSAQPPDAGAARRKDPENRLLWRANTRRLDSEEIRDAVLSVTGELETIDGGPAADTARPVRTVFTKVKRNTGDPLLGAFDSPEAFASTSQRNVTTTPTQSLLMINGPWMLRRAEAFAHSLRDAHSSPDESALITDAFRRCYARPPSDAELAGARAFLDAQSARIPPSAEENEPAPFAFGKIDFRDGRAAAFKPGSPMDRLVVPHRPEHELTDFTAEAFITLASLYEDGQVRSIVSQWDGAKNHPGWSFGITGKGSRYKPQTLVLVLSGDRPWTANDPVEPIFSGLHIETGKPYFVAVSVHLGEAGEKGVAFFAKDMSNDDEPMQTATFAHKVTSGIGTSEPIRIGARGGDTRHLFDGLIDDVRLSNAPLEAGQLMLTSPAVADRTVGYWKFEPEPNPYADASPAAANIEPHLVAAPKVNPRVQALTDFCHALLNSSEFLYTD